MTNKTAKAHILVIEDDRDIRESVAELLEKEGYSVAQAEDGLRALEYLNGPDKSPDLILLDLMMPRMDGFQFREAQLTDPRHTAIPVVVLTADTRVTDKAGTLQADGVIKKPFSIAALLEAVDRALRRSG